LVIRQGRGLRDSAAIARFDEPDTTDTDLDPRRRSALIRQLKTRFADLETDRRNKTNELAALEANPPRNDHQIKLIDRLPHLQTRLSEAPERLQRELYDAFQLEIHYNPGGNTALIRVSMADDNIDGLTRTGEAIAAAQTKTQTDSNAGQHTGTGFPGAPSAADLVCAPNGIRTRAAALKGRCPRPLDDGGGATSTSRHSIGDGPRGCQRRPARGWPALPALNDTGTIREMDGPAEIVCRDWSDLLVRLNSVLMDLDMRERSATLIITDRDEPRCFVQYAFGAALEGVTAEVVSNDFLPEERRLPRKDRKRLRADGWRKPGHAGMPNWWSSHSADPGSGYQALAGMTVTALRDVLRIESPHGLSYTAFDTETNESINLAGLGLARESPR